MSITENRKSEVAEEMEADIEYREDTYLQDERAKREDLNRGMNTGTHDFTHRGVNWPPSYRVRANSQKPGGLSYRSIVLNRSAKRRVLLGVFHHSGKNLSGIALATVHDESAPTRGGK